MKPRTLRTTAFGAASTLFLTVFFLWVPGAAAEGIGSVDVRLAQDEALPSGRLLPETGQAQLTVSASVSVNPATACVEQIQLTYRVLSAPVYASVIFNPSSQTVTVGDDGDPGTPDVPTTGASAQSYDAEPVSMIVTTTRDAPAFEDGKYEVEVVATAGQLTEEGSARACNVGEATGVGTTTIKNDYMPTTVLNPSVLFMKTGQNKRLVVPVEIVNNGNGPTRVTLQASQPGKETLSAISVGSELRLESRASRGPQALYKATRNVEVQTPHGTGYTNGIYVFNVKFSSSFDGTASGQLQTDEQVLTFAVQVQGVYVPGFDPFLLVAALGVGLVVLRRRHGPA